MTGTSSTPRSTSPTSAGNVSSFARSPVAPKITSASTFDPFMAPILPAGAEWSSDMTGCLYVFPDGDVEVEAGSGIAGDLDNGQVATAAFHAQCFRWRDIAEGHSLAG